MSQRTALLGVGLSVALCGVSPLAGQTPARTDSSTSRPGIERADVGRLEGYDGTAGIIVIGLPKTEGWAVDPQCPMAASRTFAVNDETLVLGLPPETKASALAGQAGGLVLVRYVDSTMKPMAREVQYIGRGELRATMGTVKIINTTDRHVVIQNEQGMEERMEVGRRDVIDSPAGLQALSDLHPGQQVRVYYTNEGGRLEARLVRET
jgi:hypothetical protein